MEMDIVKQLDESPTLLLLVSSNNYNEVVGDIAKSLSNKTVCYVTLNKTASPTQASGHIQN
jgi:hypothetical protein